MSSKKILIDGFNLALETGTGVATYARNLSHAVHGLGHSVQVLYGNKIGGEDPFLREISFFDTRAARPQSAWSRSFQAAKDWFLGNFGVTPVPVSLSGKVIVRQFESRLPYFDELWNASNLWVRAQTHHRYFFGRRLEVVMPSQPQIAHWTYPLPLHVRGAKNIYTLHDLVPLRLPYTTLDIKRSYFRLVRMLAMRADHIVTVSENSRRDIINLLGVPEERVTNTYQAVEIADKHADKPESVVRREIEGSFNLGFKNYLLFFGAIEPKKNVGRLIEAYLSCKIDTPLIIVGKQGWLADREMQLLNLQNADKSTKQRRMIYIDYVPHALLVSLIRGAKAVLFPSLYEGFGLPVLESMLLGTPVLTSTESSLPEVAGDAALYVDPYDPTEIAAGIRALDTDEQLRGELAEKGRKQAALFSPEAYQRRLQALYDRLVP